MHPKENEHAGIFSVPHIDQRPQLKPMIRRNDWLGLKDWRARQEARKACELIIEWFGTEKIVAKGQVYPAIGGILHGLPIEPGFVKVQVDSVEEGCSAFPVARPTDEVKTLQKRIGCQWQEERNDPGKATKLHLIPDICGSNYCFSRAPRDKNRIKTLPPELIDVSKNLVQATRELAQGSNESKAGVDPLILVLEPEHGGRTRGVRCDIGYKKGIEGYVRKKRAYEQQKDIEEIRNEVRQQMKEELKLSDFWEEMRAELKAKLRNKMKAEQNLFSPREDDVSNSVHMKSSLNSTTIMVRNETQAQQNESFSPRQEGNHISVQMRSNLSSTKSIGRKEQQGEHNESISTMQVDVPSSVQRRSNLSSTISIIREEHQGEHNESISTRQVDVPSSVHMRSNLSSTTSTVKLHCIKKVVRATATVYPIGDGILHFKKLLKGHMKVSVIKVVEIHKSKELPISDDEIPNLKFAMKGFIQWPIAAIARFTILYLLYLPLAVEKEKAANRKSLQAMEDENKVGFLNPGMITADSCFYEKWATIDYLTQSLTGYEFYLAPYLQGCHYVLFIICPKHGMGFILNSSKGSNMNEQCYRLAGLVKSVVGSLKWEFPLVNRQPDPEPFNSFPK
ncbi:ulp1 protease family, C-terminal catalytic domain-containing protein [Tanacetum coccineum]